MKGGPTYRVASRRRRNEMTSRHWQLTHQRLPCRAGIAAAPTPNPAGPRRRDDEPMMKLRPRTPIVCDPVDKNGASQAPFIRIVSFRVLSSLIIKHENIIFIMYVCIGEKDWLKNLMYSKL